MERLSKVRLKDFMTREVVSLAPGDTLADAYEKMQNHRIRHLPVVQRGQLIGVFTDRDLNHAYTPRETPTGWYYDREELKLRSVSHFMTEDPVTLNPENTLKDAATLFARNKFGCIPIVDPQTKSLVGVVSYIDVLREIAELL